MDERRYCVACLSRDRKLSPLSELLPLLRAISLWELTTIKGGDICWECHHKMTSFSSFKSQVQRVVGLMCKGQVTEEVKSFSKLSVTNLPDYNIYICQPDDTNLVLSHKNIVFTSEYETDPDKYINTITPTKFEVMVKDEICSDQEENTTEESFPETKTFEVKPVTIEVPSFKKKNVTNRRQEKKLKEVEVAVNEEDIDSDHETSLEEELLTKVKTVEPASSEAPNLRKQRVSNRRVKNLRRKKEAEIKGEEVYIEVPSLKRKQTIRKAKDHVEVTAEDREKFTTVTISEEELAKIREEKQNQPNYKKIPYKCDSCVLGFTRKDTFELHMEKKHDEKIGPHKCDVCLIRFRDPDRLARHKVKHYRTYRCKLCKYETAQLLWVWTHSRTKHKEDMVESIHCTSCQFVAKTPEEMTSHTKSEHCVYCNECGEKFKEIGTMKAHIRRIHRDKRDFICDLCKKPFKTKMRLESHMVRHNSTLAKNLAYCSLCKIQYTNIYVYRDHLRTSMKHAVHAYECPDCHKRFASKTYWKKHCDFYHQHKSEHYCELCDKLFISDWRLKCHRKTQHGVGHRSRDHHCNVCGKQFYTLATLKGHQLTHSQLRSYMCEDCGDTFKQRPALYNHYKLVHQRVKRIKRK